MKFSIVVPVYNRQEKLLRALGSLQRQTYGDFEAIVVDDCSNPSMTLGKLESDSRFSLIRLNEHSERVIARTIGIKAMSGEFYCGLDSDDEYTKHYFETIACAIEKYPDAKCFNFGAVVHWRQDTTLRKVFKPVWLGDRHEEFKSGKIGNGSFVIRKDVLDTICDLPQAKSPYKFHELATDVHHLYPYPGQSLGNPFGDDFLLFYRVTRITKSIPLNNCLYVQYVRGHL